MKSLFGLVLALLLGVCTLFAPTDFTAGDLHPDASNAKLAFTVAPLPAEPALRYVPGATLKLQQLLGEYDKQLHPPTLSQTVTRYGIEGTDLGNSFEHAGRVYFLFGDTVGRLRRALDTVATTDAVDPEAGVRLDFLKSGNDYLTIQPPGISMGAFEVPVAGISLGGQIYVAVSTNHSEDRSTDRSVLTKFTLPANFQPLRTMVSRGRVLLAVERYRNGEASLGRAAEIAGVPVGQMMTILTGFGVESRVEKEDYLQGLRSLASVW
jgi:Domain of unknown function (DUF4185)/Uncharacterised protein family (UPF0175)